MVFNDYKNQMKVKKYFLCTLIFLTVEEYVTMSVAGIRFRRKRNGGKKSGYHVTLPYYMLVATKSLGTG